jgi:O-antigen/teichoic acid export membrane protein
MKNDSRVAASRTFAFWRSISSAVASKLGSAALGVITFGFMARSLGAYGLGQYRTVLTLLLFAGVTFDFGLYPVTLREISHSGADRASILGSAVTLRLVSMLVATALLSAGLTAEGVDSTLRNGVLIAGIGWIGFQLTELLKAVFQLRCAQQYSAMAEMTGASLTLLIVILFTRAHLGTDAMLAATAAGFCLTAAMAWCFARRLVPLRPRIDLKMWRTFVTLGLPLGASAVLLNIHIRIDVLLLSVLRSPVDVGMYDAPVKLYELMLSVPYLLGGLMMPAFVRDHGTSGTFAHRLNAGITATTIFCALAFAVLFECAEPIVISLAGRDFAAAAEPLRILAASAAVAGTTALLRFAAVVLSQQGRIARADLLGVAVAVTSHLILIPRLGAIGAALSSAVLGSSAIGTLAGVCLIGSLALAARTSVPWFVAVGLCGPAVLGCVLLLPRVRNELARLSG